MIDKTTLLIYCIEKKYQNQNQLISDSAIE